MLYIDIAIIVVLLYFFYKGFRNGLIQVFGGLVGLAAGAYFAGKYAGFFGDAAWIKFASFAMIFLLANRLTALLFYVLDRIFNFLAIIPGLKSINRLAGGLAGLIEGVIVLGILLYAAKRLDFMPFVKEIFEQSNFAQPLATVGQIFLPLFGGLF